MQKMVKIGAKITNILESEVSLNDFDTLEITTKDRSLRFNIKKIEKIIEVLKGKDLSLHSQTSRVFSCIKAGFPEFNEVEIDILRAEIILCKILGCKELIFHLKQEKLLEEEKILKKLLKFAKKNNVEMIYESNGRFIGENCLDTLEKFPKLNYNLDLGHLNTAIGNKTLGMSLEKFVDSIKKRVIYVHAHNNNGIEDEHKSLNQGTLDWESILNKLNLKRIRKIIIEAKTNEDMLESKKLLEKYIKKKKYEIQYNYRRKSRTRSECCYRDSFSSIAS